ncbi:MAG: helix-turn-helix domain-containing protein [Ramlibacter sp.]|nr:helix-turn-helix domain-containing protein [Ramlibacter sp.]
MNRASAPLPPDAALAPDACYLALKARDARFDGCFFTGVTSTGIYCRPVCKVRTPRRENCRFFGHAAQAEQAGFRPCLRCRPELAPHSLRWSIQDASATLARQAARLLDEHEPEAASEGPPLIEQLAARLGVSDRHVRRIFEAEFGVSPLQYLQTRRLLTAKQLLADTHLPITQVALISGFASVRRFNAAFAGHYGLNPTQLRRQGGTHPGGAAGAGVTVKLSYRPPYDIDALLAFFGKRQIAGIEVISQGQEPPRMARSVAVDGPGTQLTGWLAVEFNPAEHQVLLRVSDSLREVLPRVIRRVRAWLDLDADPRAINAVLHRDFPDGDGLRVPGSMSGHELAVRAVLGQQITVAAARTLAQRLLDRFGDPIETPWPAIGRLFPTPQALAAGGGDAMGQLGIVRQRQAAIVALSSAVAEGRLQLHAGADVPATIATLKQLPGIGEWTAQYIAMRALRWPDAFPAADVALHKALGVATAKHPAREAEAASEAWKPWRSYAVIRAWSALPAQPAGPAPSPSRPAVRVVPNPHAGVLS